MDVGYHVRGSDLNKTNMIWRPEHHDQDQDQDQEYKTKTASYEIFAVILS